MNCRLTSPLRRHVAAPLALLLAGVATLAGADASVRVLPTVVLEGRSSLQASCPGADKAIQEALTDTMRRWRREGVMHVRFTLEGQRVTDVELTSGPGLYKTKVRQALSEMQCHSLGQQAQRHAFDIDFTFG